MKNHPFAIFAPFQHSLDVRFLTKEDNVRTDEDVSRLTGHSRIVSLHQMHGNTALRVSEPSSRTLQADAVCTDKKELTLTIRFADCQAFILFDPLKKVIGVVHAGWKGMRAQILTSTFALLKKEWESNPADVLVAAAPSLCTTCADFTDPAKEVPELKKFIVGTSIDLIAAAGEELRELGVPSKNIERMEGCTRCNPELYWSYRGGDRDKVKEGYTNVFVVTRK